MSADNWAVCPRCMDKARKDKARMDADLATLYGSIPIAEFDRRRSALPNRDPSESEHTTFREGYEIYGADSGEVSVHYCGQCTACGLTATIDTSSRFWP